MTIFRTIHVALEAFISLMCRFLSNVRSDTSTCQNKLKQALRSHQDSPTPVYQRRDEVHPNSELFSVVVPNVGTHREPAVFNFSKGGAKPLLHGMHKENFREDSIIV